jgi:hypothetical protein
MLTTCSQNWVVVEWSEMNEWTVIIACKYVNQLYVSFESTFDSYHSFQGIDSSALIVLSRSQPALALPYALHRVLLFRPIDCFHHYRLSKIVSLLRSWHVFPSLLLAFYI